MSRKISLAILLLLSASSSIAAPSEAEITETLKNKIRMVQHMALNPLLVKAVRQQNSEALSMETITQRENSWQSSEDSGDLKASMNTGHHATVMQRFIESNQAFSTICLTDRKGANVAAYPLTDHYWQGNKEGWIKSFNEGNGQVYIGSLELDSTTNSLSTYVAAPVLDRAKTIGVLLVNVRLGGSL